MAIKTELHPRNQHREGYDFERLVAHSPELEEFAIPNPVGQTTIDFQNPSAVRMLNLALLKTYYGIDAWSITFSSSQPTKNPFSSKSAFPPTRVISSGVNLNLRNGAERRPIESRPIDDTPFGRIDDTPFASGLLQEGEWYCNSCTTYEIMG